MPRFTRHYIIYGCIMKNKFISRSLAVITLFCCALSASACAESDGQDGGDGETEHVHTAQKYESNAASRWKICGDCGEKFDEATHAAYDPEKRKDSAICPVCNYKFYTEGLRFGTGKTEVSVHYSEYVTDTEIYIPDTYCGLPVKGIYGAFEGYENITRVRIPDTVNDIGGSAFKGCKSLKEITLPDGLAHLGTEAFAGCASLESVTVPETVEEILNAFTGCTNLKSIDIKCKSFRIYYGAFEGCESLESIVISGGVENIYDRAFKGCKNLKELVLPEGVGFIGKDAFAGCASLEKISLSDGLKDLRAGVFDGCEKLTYNENANGYYVGNDKNPYLVLVKVKDVAAAEFIINADCRFIYDGAFNGCVNLANITIRENIIGLGAGAFADCAALTEVVFENAGDWRHCTDASSSATFESDLRNPQKAAKFLLRSLLNRIKRTGNDS